VYTSLPLLCRLSKTFLQIHVDDVNKILHHTIFLWLTINLSHLLIRMLLWNMDIFTIVVYCYTFAVLLWINSISISIPLWWICKSIFLVDGIKNKEVVCGIISFGLSEELLFLECSNLAILQVVRWVSRYTPAYTPSNLTPWYALDVW